MTFGGELVTRRGVTVSHFLETRSSAASNGDSHELVQDDKFELQFQSVVEGLDGMGYTRLIQICKDHHNNVQRDYYQIDVDEITHDAALSDAGF